MLEHPGEYRFRELVHILHIHPLISMDTYTQSRRRVTHLDDETIPRRSPRNNLLERRVFQHPTQPLPIKRPPKVVKKNGKTHLYNFFTKSLVDGIGSSLAWCPCPFDDDDDDDSTFVLGWDMIPLVESRFKLCCDCCCGWCDWCGGGNTSSMAVVPERCVVHCPGPGCCCC